MRIKVYALASLRHYTGGEEEFFMDLENGSTLGRLLEKIKVPAPEIMKAVVDEKIVTADQELKDGEEVYLFPILSSG